MRQRATPTTVVQQAQNLPDYLETYRPIFLQVASYLKGDTSVLDSLRTAVSKARESKPDRENLNRAFAKLVIRGVAPLSLITDVHDQRSGGWLASRVHDFMACAQAVGVPINNLSYEEAKNVFNLYVKAHPASDTLDVFSALSSHGATPFPALEAWVTPRPRVNKEDSRQAFSIEKRKLELEGEITAAETAMNEATTPGPKRNLKEAARLEEEIAKLRTELASMGSENEDEEGDGTDSLMEPEPSIDEQIAALEAAMNEATTPGPKRNLKEAARLEEEIAKLRAEQAMATPVAVAPVAATPAPVATTAPIVMVAEASAANGKSGHAEFTLDDAMDLCTATNASPDLQRLLARRNGTAGKPFKGDADFIRAVGVLTGKVDRTTKPAPAKA